MVIFQHPTGNSNVRAALDGLYKRKLLNCYCTSIAIFEHTILFQLSKYNLFKELRRRLYNQNLKTKINSYFYYELGRIIASKLRILPLIAHEKGLFCTDNVYKMMDKYVLKKLKVNSYTKSVYAYEDGAAYSFEAAKQKNIKCLYDLPIGYWRASRILLEEEKLKNPAWANTLTGFRDSEKKLARKDRELELADHIFVASSFTAKTLEYYPGKLAPVSVIPYGFPPVAENRDYLPLGNRKLKVLFVGGLSQRKGISYLFEAVNELKEQIELTVVGHKAIPDCEVLNQTLSEHRWIPSLPHNEILQLMREQDLLVFPSLFEGFGLVITEAMSQGTPVITTDRTAGPDIITHGVDGWIVEAASSQAIQQQLKEIINSPELIEQTGRNALKTASFHPWSHYGDTLAQKIEEILT